jgi:hypothetical protein
LAFLRFFNLLEFVLDRVRRSDFLKRRIESFLFIHSRFHQPFNFFAQMNLQFFRGHGRFDAGSEHLFPPFRDCWFDVKHIVPFAGRTKHHEPRTIVRDV